MYSEAFFNGFILVSLASLIAVFIFQVWAFIKDKKETE